MYRELCRGVAPLFIGSYIHPNGQGTGYHPSPKFLSHLAPTARPWYTILADELNDVRGIVSTLYYSVDIYPKCYPKTINSDNGSSFCNRIMDELCKIFGIERSTSTPYHSQGNSVCEWANSVVLNLFGVLPANKKKSRQTYYEITAYCYNTSIHSTTGFSRFFLLFGRKPRLIGNALLNISFSVPKTATSKDYLNNLKLTPKCVVKDWLKNVLYFKIYMITNIVLLWF